MNRFFRNLPFAVKLIIIGFIPFLFLIYLTVEVYREKNEKLTILNHHILRVHQSATLSALIDALQEERKISFDYALGKSKYTDVSRTRPATDSLLQEVEKATILRLADTKNILPSTGLCKRETVLIAIMRIRIPSCIIIPTPYSG